MNAIQTEHLTKTYGKNRGIEDVNLTVEEGDFFGFIGPNGAGKSTTIRTLLGLISPTGGSAQIFSRDIRREQTAILADVGYLPSEAAFYSGMRVQELLNLSARLRKRDCSREAARLCERLELDPERKIEELSLGNRKKVGIVCALQHEPRMYILDEPTSGLDPLMQREFYDILKEKNQRGATIFLSSHVLSEVQRYCRHAAVIREGRITVCDSIDRLGHAGVKRVLLRGAAPFTPTEWMRDVRESDDGVTFLYNGKPDQLLKELSALTFEDLSITDPDLEEVFLHYYEKEASV